MQAVYLKCSWDDGNVKEKHEASLIQLMRADRQVNAAIILE